MIYIHSDQFTLGKKRNAVEVSGFIILNTSWIMIGECTSDGKKGVSVSDGSCWQHYNVSGSAASLTEEGSIYSPNRVWSKKDRGEFHCRWQ